MPIPGTLERDHISKVITRFSGVDKIIQEVVGATEENRKKIRRRVEDYLRKCQPEELALVVVLCGIRTKVTDTKCPSEELTLVDALCGAHTEVIEHQTKENGHD